MNYKERKAGYAVTRKRLRASIRRLRTDEENRLADENESLRAEITRHDFISAPVEPVSTLNYSKDLTVEPVPAPRLEHVLELRDDGWSLEHPPVCREGKSLLDCPVHAVVKSHEDEMELWEHGRFSVGLDEYGELEKSSSAPPVGPQEEKL